MEKILNSEIGLAVGIAIHELDEMKDSDGRKDLEDI